MARLATEYIFLDHLFDYVPDVHTDGRIEVSGEETFHKLAAEKDRPHIIFTGHLGNFELLPVAGAAFGLNVTAMFRPPNNPYIAEYVFSTRRSKMGELLASRAGAAFALARILDAGGNIGVLVDQKFQYGIRTQFFGRECETSPLVPKLAKQYDCDVYPARCIRLPGNKFRLILQEKLELPRIGDGQIDVAATAQLLTDIVERWVREDPGQWMWFHKRWNITPPKPNRANAPAESLAAVVIHHRVAGLGEKQPAFGQHAENVSDDGDRHGQRGHQPATGAGDCRDQQQENQRSGQQAAEQQRQAPQLHGMFAGDAKTHFAGQVVFCHVRPFEQPHAADIAKAGGAFGRRQRDQCVHIAAARRFSPPRQRW